MLDNQNLTDGKYLHSLIFHIAIVSQNYDWAKYRN